MRPELKRFALKFFFSNQYLYAHVQRRADGVVRAGRLVPSSTLSVGSLLRRRSLLPPPPSRRSFASLCPAARTSAQLPASVRLLSLFTKPPPSVASQVSCWLSAARQSASTVRLLGSPAAGLNRLTPPREGVLFEKPRGRPFHGKMKALVDTLVQNGVPL